MAKAIADAFYVYRILGEMGETVYIGKGCGRRLHNQKRRFKSDGEILEYCSTDKRAFRRERELISQFSPPLNKSPGGNGSTRGTPNSGLPPLYTGLAKLIRRMNGVESSVRSCLTALIDDVANQEGRAKFVAGLRPYGIEIVDG